MTEKVFLFICIFCIYVWAHIAVDVGFDDEESVVKSDLGPYRCPRRKSPEQSTVWDPIQGFKP